MEHTEHMEHMEIERKFLIDALPEALSDFPHQEFLQGYLSTSPTVRVRREGEDYVLTYKGSGLMKRMEYNLPLTAESFAHLLEKCDGLRIEKTRYRIPLSGTELTAELDVFHGTLSGLWLVEVEFPDETSARAFTPPAWFGEEVTQDARYQNSSLCRFGLPGEENT
jgi:hypothetical protein